MLVQVHQQSDGVDHLLGFLIMAMMTDVAAGAVIMAASLQAGMHTKHAESACPEVVRR